MTALTPADNRRVLAELPPLPRREPLAPPTPAPTELAAVPRAMARARVASTLATAGAALLDHRDEHRRRADDLERLRERVIRLSRRNGARRPAPTSERDDIAPSDLATVRDDLGRCEALLRDLSAAVSLRQVPRGRPTRRQAAEVDRLRAQLDEAQADAMRVATRATRALAATQRELDDALATDAASASELEALASVLLGGWDISRWAAWEPNADAVDELRIGRWLDPTTGAALALPCVVPFAEHSLEIVTHDEPQRVAAAGLLQALTVRLAAAAHGRVRLTLLDPRGGGASFPGAHALCAAVPTAAAIGACVADAIAAAERAASEHRAAAPGASSSARMFERSHVIVAADFPAAYDGPTIEALERLVRTGPAGGAYVVLHRHLVADAPAAATVAADDATVVLDLAALRAVCGSHLGAVELDGPPPRALIDVVAHRLRATPPRDAPLPWDARWGDRSTWWSSSADELVSVALGALRETGPLTLWFGRRSDRFWPSEHAIVAAMPGAGRTTFVRNLVVSLAVAYRPDDVRLAWIDSRHGTDVEMFEALPHAQLVSSRTTPAQLRGFVAELVADVRERRELFARLGVRDLGGYRSRQFAFRRRAQTSQLARLVTVIDEYEQLFDGDDGTASDHLLELVEQGGAVGIHLVLVGRNFRGVGMMRRSEVFARLQQRWALPLAPDDLAGTIDLGADGRLLAAGFLDRPGRVVANDNTGADEANRLGRSAMLDAVDAEAIVRELAARAVGDLDARSLPATIVLNGLTPPELLDNPHLCELLRNDCWHAADFLDEMARAPLAAGGLGIDEWLQADRPLPLFVGVEDGGRRPAVALLRRRPGEHLVVIGRDHGARAALLASSLASAALVEAPHSWQAWIADRSAPMQPGGHALERTAGELRRLGVDVRYGRSEAHALDTVRAAAAEVADRHGAAADTLDDRPTVLVVLAEPDRVRGLAREADGDGLVDSIAGGDLRRVLVHGPAVGVHAIVGSSSAAMLRGVLSDAVLQRDVRHRVLMQASDDDSFAVVRSAAAARLGDPAATPPSAVLFDGERHDMVRFRPYVADHDEPLAKAPRHGLFDEQVALVCARLAERLR